MAMDAKDLRTDSIDRERNEFINYEHSDTRSLSSNQNYVDSNAIPKMDVQTSRPCAVIGPDRVVPQPLSNLEFNIRKNYTEWSYKENSVCPSPDHYEKISKQHPLRNISPRQTYQENMQRVMIPPHIDTMKGTDVPTNFTSGRNITKNSTIHLADSKVIDVPYNVPQTPTEQRNFGNGEMYIPQPAATTIPPHSWTPSNTMTGRTYPQFSPSNMYRYPEYSNHTSYPVPIAHPHHVIPEENSHMYSNQFYRPGNIRYEPYPSSKDRVPHVRYDYINNYPIPCNPITYTSHKVIAPQTYATYNQVPLKYLRPHINDMPPERFQRPINPIHAFNSTYHSHEFTQNYTSAVNANCFPNKITYPNENIIKPKQINKSSNMSKMYTDYDPTFIKPCHQSENIYVNRTIPPNHMKESVITNFPPLNVQPMSHLFQYQRNINEMPNFKNTNNLPQFKTVPNDNINRMTRVHRQFSPNTPYLDSSPNFNLINNQNILQEGCTYINQSSTGKRKIMDSSKMLNPEFYKTCDTVYGSHESSIQLSRGSSHNKVKPLTDKNIDVRQFFQMWNEGDEENIDGSGAIPPAATDDCNGNDALMKSSSKPDQLYVLDLVTVPTEELGKYEHIEKISKLPDNIKGYNHIELLNQFEKVLGSSNVKYKYLQSTNSNKGLHLTENKSPQRPLSPLDVEAKISQSVIHKEVGCNFEIKPCSPKALTVDIVAPAQVTSIERQIEKVINPHVQSLSLPSAQNDISNDCDLVKEHTQHLKLQLEEPSTCKLTEAKGSDIEIKTNYNLQEFNTNSGVYLASLPRLDNDIEFNFPEVNQQFLDANKMESEVNKSKHTNAVYPVVNETNNKNSLYELQSSALNESNKLTKATIKHVSIDIKSPIPPDCENAKESTKLSKFRKIKNHISNVSENSLVKAQCPDSINVKISNIENIPTLEVDTILSLNESNDDLLAPMNLSSTKSHVIQYVTSLNSIQTVRKLENSKNETIGDVINLATNAINNQNNSCVEIIQNKNYSEENYSKVRTIAVEETVTRNLPYIDECVKESKHLMEMDNNKDEAEKSATEKIRASYEVHLKNIDMNINENLTQLDQDFVNTYKNKSDSKVAVLLEESCIKNISDHRNYKNESNAHQIDNLHTFVCPNEFTVSMPYNKAVQEEVDTKSKKNVSVNSSNLLNNSTNIPNENNINNQTSFEHSHDTSNYVSSTYNGTSEIISGSNNNNGELELNEEHVNIKGSITEDKMITGVLETKLPLDSSCVLKFSENKSMDPFVIKTDITNNKDFQLNIIQQDINSRNMQNAQQNVSVVINDKKVNTNISTDKIVYCLKQECTNKDIICQENNASINSCNVNFSTENEEKSKEIELVLSENNIGNSISKQSLNGSPPVQETTSYNTTVSKCKLNMDVDVICKNNININKSGSNIMFSKNSIIKEENKNAPFRDVMEIAHDLQSQNHNEEIKSKIYKSLFRHTFSKEIFSPRIQNLLINSEGIIVKKESTSCEISVLTSDCKEMYFDENFEGTESQNIKSVYIPCVQNEAIKSTEEDLSEKMAKEKDPIEDQSDIILELNSPETIGSHINLPNLSNIKENNQIVLSNNCVESDNYTSQISTSDVHNFNTKNLIVEKSLKCSKCETSCRNNSTQKSRLLRRKLRSLSESDICQYDLEFANNTNSYDKVYPSRQKKTKRDVDLTLEADNRNSVSNNCRRNSIASILNDQNLSVCILIDSDCLITDESLDNVEDNECYSFQEDEEILCSNEDSVSTTVLVPIENNTIQEETIQQNNEADICVDKDYGDFWVDDVGCIETVVSDEIIESNESSLPIFETEKNDMSVEPLETMLGKNFDSAKIRAIYGSNILKSDIKLVESFYKTPQMNVNDKLKRPTNSHIQIEDENKPNKAPFVNAQSSATSSISDKSTKNERESTTVSDLDIHKKNISDSHTTTTLKYHKKKSCSLSTSVEKYLIQSEDDYESDSSTVYLNKRSTSLVQRHISVLPTMEISDPIQTNSFNTSASSSPEVSSTTSEEKSNILLKICKYETSIATCIKPENGSEFSKKGLRCKLTEVNHYGKFGHSSTAFKPLITKAAQKYIPPPKGTDNNLKIKLPLPEHRLEKLKRLKMSKDIPKSKNNDLISSRDMESSKKIKPNFEDVLRNIDEVQYKLHKSKCKIKQTIPKVVIKKGENGSHYASTSKIYNPDLTGRKWQPWVFLEKNYFIDKMALKKNTKAIYCHKRDTYVIADKIGNNKKVELNGTSTKLIISRPKGNLLKVPLKYTIRWTHPY